MIPRSIGLTRPSAWQKAPNGVRRAVKYKTTEQAHVSLAVPAIPLDHPDRHALSFLSVILGEGMSSRLFMELREKRGLVYDVHTYVAHFLDTGTFNVYTGVDPKKADQAIRGTEFVLQQGEDRVQFLDRAFQFADGIVGQFIGRRQFVRVFEGFIFQPFEAVELEVALHHVADGE